MNTINKTDETTLNLIKNAKTRQVNIQNSTLEETRFPVLVVINGNILDVGKTLLIEEKAKLIIGRDIDSDFPVNDRLVSRKHFEVNSLKKEKDNYSLLIKDLESTNGTFIKGRQIAEERIRLGETIEVGSETIFLFRTDTMTNIKEQNLVLSMVSKDSLTGVYNRRAFDQLIEHMRDKYAHTDNSFVLLLIDLDHFKIVNDTFGHPVGDRVLKTIASLIHSEIRAEDILARLGGDEFAILLPKSGIGNAAETANRLLKMAQELRFEDKTPLNISFSIGISANFGGKIGTSELYKQADKALYQAKQKGRNTYVIYGDS